MFRVLKKHSFSLSLFAAFVLSPPRASLSLISYLNEEAPSPTPVQRSKTALALFRSRASHQYTWLRLWAT